MGTLTFVYTIFFLFVVLNVNLSGEMIETAIDGVRDDYKINIFKKKLVQLSLSLSRTFYFIYISIL